MRLALAAAIAILLFRVTLILESGAFDTP